MGVLKHVYLGILPFVFLVSPMRVFLRTLRCIILGMLPFVYLVSPMRVFLRTLRCIILVMLPFVYLVSPMRIFLRTIRCIVLGMLPFVYLVSLMRSFLRTLRRIFLGILPFVHLGMQMRTVLRTLTRIFLAMLLVVYVGMLPFIYLGMKTHVFLGTLKRIYMGTLKRIFLGTLKRILVVKIQCIILEMCLVVYLGRKTSVFLETLKRVFFLGTLKRIFLLIAPKRLFLGALKRISLATLLLAYLGVVPLVYLGIRFPLFLGRSLKRILLRSPGVTLRGLTRLVFLGIRVQLAFLSLLKRAVLATTQCLLVVIPCVAFNAVIFALMGLLALYRFVDRVCPGAVQRARLFFLGVPLWPRVLRGVLQRALWRALELVFPRAVRRALFVWPGAVHDYVMAVTPVSGLLDALYTLDALGAQFWKHFDRRPGAGSTPYSATPRLTERLALWQTYYDSIQGDPGLVTRLHDCIDDSLRCRGYNRRFGWCVGRSHTLTTHRRRAAGRAQWASLCERCGSELDWPDLHFLAEIHGRLCRGPGHFLAVALAAVCYSWAGFAHGLIRGPSTTSTTTSTTSTSSSSSSSSSTPSSSSSTTNGGRGGGGGKENSSSSSSLRGRTYLLRLPRKKSLKGACQTLVLLVISPGTYGILGVLVGWFCRWVVRNLWAVALRVVVVVVVVVLGVPREARRVVVGSFLVARNVVRVSLHPRLAQESERCAMRILETVSRYDMADDRSLCSNCGL